MNLPFTQRHVLFLSTVLLAGCATALARPISNQPDLPAVQPVADQPVATKPVEPIAAKPVEPVTGTPVLVAAPNILAPAAPPVESVADKPAMEFGKPLPLDPAVPQSGMRLGPALCLIRDLPLGKSTDLAAVGLPVQVENRSTEELRLALVVAPPIQAGMSSWERGYEAIPDPTWLQLTPDHIVLPPRTYMQIVPTISIPDRPELANRRFLVTFTLSAGGPGAAQVGAGLALCGRMQFETQVSVEPVANAGSPLSFAPSASLQPGAPNATTTHVVKLRNNQAVSQKWELRPLERTIPISERQPRYYAAVPGHVMGWSVADIAGGELAPGQEIDIRFTTNVPANAGAGVSEEIWFAGAPEELDLAASTDASRQPLCAFIRLHHQIGSTR